MWAGRSNSSWGVPICNHPPVMHHDDLVREGQRLGLVVGHVDHRMPELVVQCLFQLCVRSSHFICGSITVRGSSKSSALTSSRTMPRPRADLLLGCRL